MHEFRCSSGDRHREHPPAQRVAPAHRDLPNCWNSRPRQGRSSGHHSVAGRAAAGFRGHAGERLALCEATFGGSGCSKATASVRVALTQRAGSYAILRDETSLLPGPTIRTVGRLVQNASRSSTSPISPPRWILSSAIAGSPSSIGRRPDLALPVPMLKEGEILGV